MKNKYLPTLLSPTSHRSKRLGQLVLVITFLIAIVSLTVSVKPAKAVLNNGYPEKFAIYYGNPAIVSGATNLTEASAVFDDYDMLLLGEGIEQATHSYHNDTQTIIQNITATTRVYGYIDLCVQNPVSSLYRCSNFSETELQSRADKWKAMGAAGIFLDQAGCDYVVSRDRQNQIIDYAHSQGLSVMINVWDQDSAFSTDRLPSPYDGYEDCNPDHLPSHLGANDYTLLESWAVLLSDWSENWSVDPNMLYPRGDKALKYKNQYGVKVATVNTIGYNNPPFNQQQFDYVWWTTSLYGFDAMAWGETWVYSADCQCLPFHDRPNPGDIGSSILPLAVSNSGDIHTRTTTVGYISVDAATHTGAFITDGTPPPSLTPSITPTPSPTPFISSARQSVSAATDIASGNVSFTGGNVRFIVRTNGAPWEYFSLFIDTDNDSSTGYRVTNAATGQAFNHIGAEKMIQNGYIYNWGGNNSNQFDWNWAYADNATVTGVGTSQLSVSATYAQLGYAPSTIINILAQHTSTSYATYDFLYRDPALVWQASSEGTPTSTPTATASPTPASTPVVSSISQSGSTDTDIIAGNTIFDGSNITFRLQTNGAPWAYFRIFIDMDNNSATGFQRTNSATGQVYTNIGADKLIENGYIYNWAGSNSNQTAWGWSFTGNSAIGSGSGTRQLALTMTYDQLGYSPSSAINILVEHVSTSYVTYDFLYRDLSQVWHIAAQDPTPGTPVATATPTSTPTPANIPDVSGYTTRQVGTSGTDIVAGDVSFANSSVTFTMLTNGTPWQYFSLFVDTDGNPSTGYRPTNAAANQAFSGVGAEKLIQNGYIYNWGGNNSNQFDWNWAYVDNATVIGVGTSQLSVNVTYAQLGYTPSTTINILGQHMSTGYATYDFLYRDPALVWQASSQPLATSKAAVPSITPSTIPATLTATPTAVIPTNTAVPPTSLPTNPPGKVRPKLKVSAECSTAPNLYHTWRVVNKGSHAVTFDWMLVGMQQSGSLRIAADSDLVFQTISTTSSSGSMSISVNGEVHDVAKDVSKKCH